MLGSSSLALLPTAGTRRRPSTPTTTHTLILHGDTSVRWSGVTARVLGAPLVTAPATSTGRAASTAVSSNHRIICVTVLTTTDYSFFGNNIAAGQFEAQVWAPVCKDPDVAEVTKREDVNFNWARV
jgi:hypothetical protein